MPQTLSDHHSLPAGAARVPGRALSAFASTFLIAAAFLVCTIHVTPFTSLQATDSIGIVEGGNLATQIVFSALFAFAAWLLARIGPAHLGPLATPWLTGLGAWIALSMLFSQAPVTSLRRFLLTAICIVLSAAIPLAARSVRHLALTLAWVAAGILVVSYLSIVLVPDTAMHTRLDLREPDLAGDWRGPFSHKNEAGAVMVLFVFIGILAWNVGARALGAFVGVAAALFLAFTHSKTAGAVLPAVLAVVALARLTRGALLTGTLLLAPVALVGTISLGSFFLAPLRQSLEAAGLDITFTGRTQIWEFALAHIGQRPVMGWGYGAFWRTEATQLAYSGSENWFAQADQAHNAYLDIAVFMGLPGLALTLIALVGMPLRDVLRAGGGRGLDALSAFLVSVWIYVLCTAFFESVLFEGNSALFLLFMLAVFGLRYRTLVPVVAR